jgi:hypothetical protein
MIRTALFLAAASLLATSLRAAEGHATISEAAHSERPYHLKTEPRLLRTSFTLTPDVAAGDDLGYGFELAAGRAIHPLDALAVFVGHMDADRSDLTTVGLFAEESYLTDLPVVPYAAAGLGYAFTQQQDDVDAESIIAEFELGAKLRLCSRASFNVGAEINWANEEVFPSTDGLEDKQWRFVAGLTLHY